MAKLFDTTHGFSINSNSGGKLNAEFLMADASTIDVFQFGSRDR
ncbi:hypothetical protein [Sessilibacter corallicola]